MAPSEARDLFTYTRWANERVLEAVAGLPEETAGRDLGSSFPSVRETLAHMAAAEWIWLERLNGRSPTAGPEGWDTATVAGVAAAWRSVAEAWRAFVEDTTEATLARRIRYATLRGDPYASDVAQILRHVANHATYHRGQVTTMLRQLGVTPPSTDYIAWDRARTAATAPAVPTP